MTAIVFRRTIPADGAAWRAWLDHRIEEREKEQEARRRELADVYERMFGEAEQEVDDDGS